MSFLLSFNQGSIPLEIGSLSNLTHLRMSYNEFTGNASDLVFLQHLQLIHLHGNRLHGTMPEMTSVQRTTTWWTKSDPKDQANDVRSGLYGFISDCGHPSDFNPSLVCDSCTMCCKPLCRSCFPVSSIPPHLLTHHSLAFVECF